MVEAIAVKVVLQKTLFAKLVKRVQGLILSPGQFPLTTVVGSTGIAYRSAIALKLAAQTSLAADTVAHDLSHDFVQHPDQEDGSLPIAWADWSMQIEASGWLIFTLSNHGIRKWLQHICSPLAKQSLPPFVIDTLLEVPSRHPPVLCHQLQLSPPMFLQWSHARCCRWLQVLEAYPYDSVSISAPLSLSSKRLWGWTVESPLPCHHLLQALCTAIDRIAIASTEPDIWLTQGYAVAIAFYEFQSALSLGTVQQRSPAVQTSIWSLMQAVRHLLAQVITTVYQQEPAQSF